MSETRNDQARLWNGAGGRGWADVQPLLDGILKPFEDLIVGAVAASSASRVLDVGCGTGATTLAIARAFGTNGTCLGIDIAQPMIAVARDRAGGDDVPARFVCADAQTYGFDSPCYDMIVSRFGVMFFEDPTAAFANLRRAARPGAALFALAWRSADANAFMTTAERYAAPLLPNIPVRKPGEPGQFAFADDNVVRRILDESGWTNTRVEPIDVACAFPEAALLEYITRLGPVGRILSEMGEEARAPVASVVRAAFQPYVHDDEVHFDAACWIVRAEA